MKKLFFIALFQCLFLFQAQDIDQEYRLRHRLKLKAELLSVVGLGYEIPLNDYFLVDVNLGRDFFPFLQLFFLFPWEEPVCNVPFASVALNCYVSRKRRIRKGRHMQNNSGSFVGFGTQYHFVGKSINEGDLSVEAYWGQNLAFDKRFSFHYRIGAGFSGPVFCNDEYALALARFLGIGSYPSHSYLMARVGISYYFVK